MVYPNFKKTLKKNHNFNKTFACALILANLFFIFTAPVTSSQNPLPDCKTFVGNQEPGKNCLFYGLPLCQNIPSAPYNIPASSIFTGIDEHRVNCADFSDLPLCSQMDPGASPIKDCVKECSDSSFDGGVGIRGTDYAIHNRDCVRFCDAPENGIIANPSSNCSVRSCHQLPSGIDPEAGINCDLKICNLLTPDELNETIFDDDTKQYCNGNDVKCYEFTRAQLPFIKMREHNKTCQIHDCRVAESCVSHSDDDLQQILNKASIDALFLEDYQNYAYYGYDINSDLLCNKVNCQPVFYRQYRCEPMNDNNPTTPNVNCDLLPCSADINNPGSFIPNDDCGQDATCSGDGFCFRGCNSGYCNKTIDCNLAENNSESECFQSGSNIGNAFPPDDTNSWFYRPRPDSGAVTGNGIVRTMRSDFCYTRHNMETDHGWGYTPVINLGFTTISLGYFHYNHISPQMCEGGTHLATKLGNRGNGYIYLCGTSGLLYNLPSSQTAYFRGYSNSNYIEGGGTHNVTICLRFNNTMDPQMSCGERECMVVCAYSLCTQHCGFDKCETLTIDENQPKQCQMDDRHFNGDNESNCSQIIDSGVDNYLRIRAVKYGNYICGFFDFKGTFAYDAQYFNGGEKLSDGTCISGDNVDGACQGAKNTNVQYDVADVWRTVMMVPYIQNNRPAGSSGPRGYLDINGRIFKEQECPKLAYRITTPRHYNLANKINSPNIFTPPIYILNTRTIRGGPISSGSTPSNLGVTDFHYPEIEVRFGTATQKLSLGIDYTGYEQNNIDPLSSATITTNVDNFEYSLEIFVRKEQVQNTYPIQPTLCLYRRVKDTNGAYLDPLRIACVDRKLPEIDNSQIFNPILPLRKILIAPHASSTFDSPKISFRYLSNNSSLNANSCSDPNTECTSELILENNIQQTPNCYNNLESKKLCAQREECSKLNIECIQNEIEIGNALANNQPINSLLVIRKNCNEILLPICNAKKGLDPIQVDRIVDYDYNNTPASDPNIYGWFNEICINSGFETKLKAIVAHQLNNALKGKCLIDSINSPYLTDNNPDTNCDSGGKAPNCLCVQAVDGVTPPQGYEVRTETLREAGLCIDIPIPETCEAIDYNKVPNSDINDLEYILTSVNNSSYGGSNSDIIGKVHISHKYRSQGKPEPNAFPLRGHAEFPTTVFGVNNVAGECKGFWTYQRSSGGNIIFPRLNCINNNGSAEWESDARNACVRFSCPEVFTSGPDANGSYQGTYGISEVGESKGSSHGFALWPSHQKTNDFLELVTANSCITGFKKSGAIPQTSSGSVSGSNAIIASLYNLITNYSGGILPTRQCNQIGQWQEAQDVCQRIACPEINPPAPNNPSDSAAWELWRNSGGATFPSVNASRSTIRIQSESISTGTCNSDLGFFRNPGGSNPTRKCDHLGNWLPVENPCVTECDEVGIDDADNFNNGFALWEKFTGVFDPNGSPGTFINCIAGYVTNPYPPFQDQYGNPLPASEANNLSRPAQNPMRLCTTGISNLGVSSNVWSAVVNGCINSCPGYDVDQRTGVGRTTLPSSTGNINFDWPSTPLGEDVYISNFTESANFDASYFTQNRTNRFYLVKRHCNLDGSWSDPEPMCAANNGQVDNATYDRDIATSGNEDSIAVSFASSIGATISGVCIQNHWHNNFNQEGPPIRACLYEDENLQQIDKTYLALVNSSNDCEEKRCPALDQYLGERAYFPQVSIEDNRTRAGQQVIGSCINNQNNKNNILTFTSLENGSAPPRIICGDDGVWSDIIDEGNCKKGCDYPTITQSFEVKDCGSSSNVHTLEAGSLQHGQIYESTMTGFCDRGDCDSTFIALKCTDGNLESYSQVNNFGSSHDYMCPIGFYDFENHIYKTKTLFSSTSYNTANNQYAGKIIYINEIGNTNINKRGITFTPNLYCTARCHSPYGTNSVSETIF